MLYISLSFCFVTLRLQIAHQSRKDRKKKKTLTICTTCEMLAKPFTLKLVSLVYDITTVSWTD